MTRRLGDVPARSEAVIDLDLAQVGDHVARHSPVDADGVEALSVDQALHLHFARLVLREPAEDRRCPMDRVVADPCPRAVGSHTVRADDRAQVAVAAAFDLSVGRLAEDREVAGEQIGTRPRQAGEPVEVGIDLLVVVPHPRDVDAGSDQLGRQLQLHGDAGLHVHGAPAPDEGLTVDVDVLRRDVGVDRDGVDVAGDHDALSASEVRAGDDGVAVSIDLEVSQRRDLVEDGVGQELLVAGLARNVADDASEFGRGQREIERRHPPSLPRRK